MNYTCRVVQDEDNRTFVIHLFLSVLVWCILTAGMAVIDPMGPIAAGCIGRSP